MSSQTEQSLSEKLMRLTDLGLLDNKQQGMSFLQKNL